MKIAASDVAYAAQIDLDAIPLCRGKPTGRLLGTT